MKYPYELINGTTGSVVCRYKSLSIAHRDGVAKNVATVAGRYYVRKVASGKLLAC